MLKYLIIFSCLSLISSCVSRKQIVLFQDKSEQRVKIDSTGNTFSAAKYEYTLKAGDILNIRIGSLTDPSFDFISQYEMQMGEYLTLSPNTTKNNSNPKSNGNSLVGTSSVTMSTAAQQNLFSTPLKPNVYVEQQSHGYKINAAGNISLPAIGEVAAAGLSLPSLDSLLQSKFNGFFEKVQVRCQLINFHFTVMGEVKTQGRFTNFNPEATLLEAINMAENFTEFADRGRIKIIRTQNNKKQVLYCNLLTEEAISSAAFQLYPDDIIIVPELAAKKWRNYTLKDMQLSIGMISGVLSIVALYVTLRK